MVRFPRSARTGLETGSARSRTCRRPRIILTVAKRRRDPTGAPPEGGYVRRFELRRDDVPSFDRYPFNIAAINSLDRLELDRHVTMFVGENGSGKSTLIEAIAIAIGINPEGGSKNFNFATNPTHSSLADFLQIVRGSIREQDAYFLRGESMYNVATNIDAMDKENPGSPLIASYGGRSLHEQSHGESFLALMKHRLGGGGIYLFDEPESALSPSRQIAMLSIMHTLTTQKASQIILATHSPILMAYPNALIYHLSENGLAQIDYKDTEHYQTTKAFLTDPGEFLHHLGMGDVSSG